MDAYYISVASNMGMIAFIALSAYLLLIVGEISFGQQAYFAIGAYASGVATALWGWSFLAGLGAGIVSAALAAGLVALPTLRLRGLYFSVVTLAFAEMVRLGFEVFTYQVEIDGELVGPNGSDGFRDIRYVYERDVSDVEYMLWIYGLLVLVLAVFFLAERSRFGLVLRMIGEDPLLAEVQGIRVVRCKFFAVVAAGAIAGIGGVLYAHLATYVEPKIFNVMLGVHSLAYGIIGGLGTALGPLLGVFIDIGLLESIRALSGYRMIVFGALVALLLVVRPRGLLDERTVYAITARAQRLWSCGDATKNAPS
ncbi:MAG: branched-chain amino acid ABC transporter permease [Gammaproteobacteria bacterium]|nr:branched-chain amino acid ABC transporter permease [Gammaproteobacteria bacterium]